MKMNVRMLNRQNYFKSKQFKSTLFLSNITPSAVLKIRYNNNKYASEEIKESYRTLGGYFCYLPFCCFN